MNKFLATLVAVALLLLTGSASQAAFTTSADFGGASFDPFGPLAPAGTVGGLSYSGYNVTGNTATFTNGSVGGYNFLNLTFSFSPSGSIVIGYDLVFKSAASGTSPLTITFSGSGFTAGLPIALTSTSSSGTGTGTTMLTSTYSGSPTPVITTGNQSLTNSVPLTPPPFTLTSGLKLTPVGTSGLVFNSGNGAFTTEIVPAPTPPALALAGLGVPLFGLIGLKRKLRKTAPVAAPDVAA